MQWSQSKRVVTNNNSTKCQMCNCNNKEDAASDDDAGNDQVRDTHTLL